MCRLGSPVPRPASCARGEPLGHIQGVASPDWATGIVGEKKYPCPRTIGRWLWLCVTQSSNWGWSCSSVRMQSSYSQLRTTEIVRYGGQDEHLAQAASGCFWLYRLTHLTRGYGGEPSWPVKSVNLHRDKTQHQQQSTQHRNQRKAIVQHFNHQYPFILMAKKSLHSICSKKIYYRNKYNIWNSICIILLQ